MSIKCAMPWSNEILQHDSPKFYISQRIPLEVLVAATYNPPSFCSKANLYHIVEFSVCFFPRFIATYDPNF